MACLCKCMAVPDAVLSDYFWPYNVSKAWPHSVAFCVCMYVCMCVCGGPPPTVRVWVWMDPPTSCLNMPYHSIVIVMTFACHAPFPVAQSAPVGGGSLPPGEGSHSSAQQ